MPAKTAMLTGATGFVGANLARRLLQEGHQVHLLVREGHAEWRLAGIRDRVYLHRVELDDLPGLQRVVDQVRPEWVFHLAAHGAYSWQTDLEQMVRTNVLGTANLVEACVRVGFEAFVNTGSSSEYGSQDHPPAEGEPLEPNSHYACTKAAASLLCRYTARSRGVNLRTLRLYTAYGPYEEPARLFPTLILRGMRGELPPLVDPDTARDYVFVEDVCDAYLLAASRPDQEPGAIYNVGSGTQTTLRRVVDLAREVLGIRDAPDWGSMPARAWDTDVWVADSHKIRDVLGWQPRTSLEEGFRRTVDWFRQNSASLPLHERKPT